MIVKNEILLGEVECQLRSGHNVSLRAKGNSMLPFIRSGKDCVELKPIETVNVGDVVLAKLENKNYVLHRVIRVENNDVILMGDGNIYETETCRKTDILGVVTGIWSGDRVIDCSDKKYRRKVFWWIKLRPIRRLLLKIIKK